MNRVYFYAGVIVSLIAAGIGLGYYWFRPEPPKPETYAPAAIQADGSTIVERKPQANARPKAQVPKGAKVERIVRFEVKPLELPLQASLDGAGAIETSCPSLDMELTLVELPDESSRVILRSERGEVLNAVDIPVSSAKSYKELKWAAGLTANPLDRTLGGFIDRDMGPFRLGAEVNQIRDGFDLRLKAGVRF